MSYTPPVYNAVDLYFETALVVPAFNAVDLFYGDESAAGILLYCVDDITFDESLVDHGNYTSELIEDIHFDDLVAKYLFLELSDTIYFHSEMVSKDFAVKWRARTKTALQGYGGIPFGDIGYGSGRLKDIVSYHIEVFKNSTGALVRTVDINVSDIENPDVVWFYSYVMNVADNGTYTTNLTFNIYQVSSEGVYSLVKQLSHS